MSGVVVKIEFLTGVGCFKGLNKKLIKKRLITVIGLLNDGFKVFVLCWMNSQEVDTVEFALIDFLWNDIFIDS